MEEVGKILPSVFKRHMRHAAPRVVEILAPLWPRVAGKAMARRCQPVAFSAGTLTLAADCSCWGAQLQQMAEEIRAEVNSFLGGPVVKKLRVRCVDQLDPAWLPEPQQAISPAPEVSQTDWPANEASFDPDMARTIGRSYAKYFGRRQKGVH